MPLGVLRESGFDALVIGAGPCGSAAAAELARQGFAVALVGRSGDQRPNVGECLPPGIRPQLEKAGVWEEFLRAGHIPSAGIRSFWGAPAPSERDFVFSPYRLGWHIDRAGFDRMMRNSAVRSGVESLECTTLRKAEFQSERWRVEFTHPSEDYSVTARLVVDATGRSSVFARRVGAKRNVLDRLAGVAGYFSPSAAASRIDPVLSVEAVENGWWYTAPLPQGRLIAVFMTDAEFIQRQKLTREQEWKAQLSATIEQSRRIADHGFLLESPIRVVQAESSFLDCVAGDGWLAAGDAAMAFDPLSSQGITAAIASGLDAGLTATAWLKGDERAPVDYAQRMRKAYAEYLAHRSVYYRIERRWSESDFWKIRHATAAVSAGKAVCA